jgi:hypothetical protein
MYWSSETISMANASSARTAPRPMIARHGAEAGVASPGAWIVPLLQRREFVLEMDAAGLSPLWVRDASASSSSMSWCIVASA